MFRPAVFRFALSAALLLGGGATVEAAEGPLRPPSVPLVTSDPYLSIWSNADMLTDDVTRHWTKREQSLASVIRVDGKTFRLMGNQPADEPAMTQTALRVLPTRTIYEFEGAGIHVTLTFLTPALPSDFEVLARPLTYLTWTVQATDGKPHEVSVFDSTSSQLAVNKPEQKVVWKREKAGSLTVLRVGTEDQTLLKPAGDDTRIDWGYVYAAASGAESKSAIGGSKTILRRFVDDGTLPEQDEPGQPRAANDREPALAFVFNLGQVSANPVSRRLMIAYDEIYSINFLGQKLCPYWRRNGAGPADLLTAADHDYDGLVQRCEAFDRELMADAARLGGERYAQIVALSHRQGLAGCGFAADAAGQPMIFTKENTSNGCIATVDVFYPAAPQFLLFGPAMAKGIVAPVLVYSQSPQWKLPFAPHDIGVYPQATGQVYGGGEHPVKYEDMMPVEESGNMLILCDAICQMDGDAEFVSTWWSQLTSWEDYLEKYGYDPENQLCTDDFMGHLAHNANLSLKAIVAIAAYGDMCRIRGDRDAAEKYIEIAKKYADHWMQVSDDGGDHYRLAFDKPKSWSQKYNLVWDRLLNLDIFPTRVAEKEVAYYLKQIQPFGLPLDSRTRLTKTDWSVWSATLADNQPDFEAIVSPIYDYLNRTSARVALADSYQTDNIKSDGMHARPVVGGIFIKMLSEATIWKKYYAAGTKMGNQWAAYPTPPQVTPIIPTSLATPATWRYTTDKPSADWTKPEYDDSAWKEGAAGFGTARTPGGAMRTLWDTPDIWLRRKVTLPNEPLGSVALQMHHDEDAEVYVNGVLAASEPDFVSKYEVVEINSAEALAQLKPGAKITLAVHCHQTQGGQYIDVGIAKVIKAETRQK